MASSPRAIFRRSIFKELHWAVFWLFTNYVFFRPSSCPWQQRDRWFLSTQTKQSLAGWPCVCLPFSGEGQFLNCFFFARSYFLTWISWLSLATGFHSSGSFTGRRWDRTLSRWSTTRWPRTGGSPTVSASLLDTRYVLVLQNNWLKSNADTYDEYVDLNKLFERFTPRQVPSPGEPDAL